MSDTFEVLEPEQIRSYLALYEQNGDEALPVHLILTERQQEVLKAADRAIYYARLSDGDPEPAHGLYFRPDLPEYDD